MKIAQGMKIIKEGWIQKPEGFRVKYQKYADSELITEYSPDLDNNPFDSDNTAWRYAWKLYVSTKTDQEGIQTDEMVNITVVDTKDRSINYYATGMPKVYNQK